MSLVQYDARDEAFDFTSHFREDFYACLTRRDGTLFELTDAMLCEDGPVTSPVDLTLLAKHRRGHGAMYDALNQGRIDAARLRKALAMLPQPKAADNRLFCHVYGRSGRSSDQFIPGWPYSFVAALETRRTSWCQLLDAVRLGPDDDVAEVTAAQVRRVVTDLIGQGQWEAGDPDILVVFDAGYDAPRMAYLLTGLPVEVLGRMRSDRVAPSGALPQGVRPGLSPGRATAEARQGVPLRQARHLGRGRRGDRVGHDRYGTAQAMAWDRIHPRLITRSAWIDHDGELPVIEGTLIRLKVDHVPGGREPLPLWLWSSKTGLTSEDVDRRWQGFLRRFDLEHTFCFEKQTLSWTRPRLRTPEAADRWTWIVIAAHTQLRLTREAAADLRRPWEKPAEPARLTPARVRRGFRNICPHLHNPARAPKPSTPGPGRPLGSKNRRPTTRYDVGKTTRRPESIAERNQLKAHKP
ncbi:transposase [Streptomyces sp. NPDC057743]|uniref:transposase n=1 Tax=Streptomyces sp. NPDC057743 TaxID=3346236 RepID=UPI003688502F